MLTKGIISINSVCNLRCKMCDIGQKNAKSSGIFANWQNKTELVPKEWKNILDRLGINWVHIQGTEPLLYEDLDELLKLISPKRFIYLTTNGFLLPHKAEILAKYCDLIAISIDSADATLHNYIRGIPAVFENCMSGINLLNKLNFNKIRISCTITPDNHDSLIDVYNLFHKSLGFSIVFNHYNFIHPENCKKYDCQATNFSVYNPQDINVDKVFEAVKYCEAATFLPSMKKLSQLKEYYYEIPSARIKNKPCKILNAITLGNRYVISSDGSYIISSRCWYSGKIGSALNPEFSLKDSEYLININKEIKTVGLPEPCQRLCCAGRVL